MSFNGKFRDECQNANWFTSLRQAKNMIEQWRCRYNNVRPHSALNYATPTEFAQNHASIEWQSPAQFQQILKRAIKGTLLFDNDRWLYGGIRREPDAVGRFSAPRCAALGGTLRCIGARPPAMLGAL